MSEPTIICPSCKSEIKLTESLAAPLIESTKKQYQEQLEKKDLEVVGREETIRQKENNLKEAQRHLDEQVLNKVQEQLKKERASIIQEEAKKAKLVLGTELENKTKELSDLQELLKAREEKLAVAQKAEAEFMKRQRELDDAKREMDLTIEKRIHEGLENARVNAKKEAEDSLNLKLKEREQTIFSMQKQIEELKRKAEQGSQQLQGEVQELLLESMLQTKFPFDSIESVPKGEFGGDVMQKVADANGQICGTILWESKRTKNWSEGWLAKLKDDQRTAKAEISVIVSQALPPGVETFEMINGVWVTHPRAAYPVAMVLRQSLLEVAMVRNSAEGQQTKMEVVYQYLTGPRFRQRVEAIVDAFSSMQSDLEKERKVIMKQWAKRNEQIERVMGATIGMYGDLQGIAGKSLQEIDGLELKSLETDDDFSESN
ncbi:coiled-coil protein [Legionella santicrucis]|uniref:Coiled-coil protein n=2 Tax=Legionella santicrucis TaxID=45074 RepID=A0A0W0Z3E3_9GAMM|nr:coiled-coil protein [Legionella santicrucis]